MIVIVRDTDDMRARPQAGWPGDASEARRGVDLVALV